MNDEGDEILVMTLKELQCPVEEGASSLKELSPNGVYGCTAFCLNTIIGQPTFPKALPKQVPVKVNICTKLVAEIKARRARGVRACAFAPHVWLMRVCGARRNKAIEPSSATTTFCTRRLM